MNGDSTCSIPTKNGKKDIYIQGLVAIGEKKMDMEPPCKTNIYIYIY